jgi:esterase
MVNSAAPQKERSAARSPSLVFIHGFLDDGASWADVIANLESVPASRAFTPDLPGMGKLSNVATPHNLLELTRYVLDETDGIDDPVVIVGHSMGAQIAELAAISAPYTVAGLVLISPVPLGGIALSDETADAMRKLASDGQAQRQMRQQLSVSLPVEKLDAMVISGLTVKPEIVSSLVDTWSTGSRLGSDPTTFSGPVLIVGGADDGFSTPELLKTVIAPRFPQASLVFEEHTGHWPHVEAPSEIASKIDSFLRLAGR